MTMGIRCSSCLHVCGWVEFDYTDTRARARMHTRTQHTVSSLVSPFCPPPPPPPKKKAAANHKQKARLDLKVLLGGQDHLQLLINLLTDAGFHIAHGGQVAKGDAHFRAHLLAVHFTENVKTLAVGFNGFVDVPCHGVHLTQLVKSAHQVA